MHLTIASRAALPAMMLIATGAAAACGPSASALIEARSYPEVCALSADRELQREDRDRFGQRLAEDLNLDLEARLLTPAEAEAHFGMTPGDDLHFVAFRWRARTAAFGGTVRASASIFREAATDGALRYVSVSILPEDDVFPPPASLTHQAIPRSYVRQGYEPTPRPTVHYTGGRGPNAMESAVSGLASALTLGWSRRATGTRGRLTRASRRAVARWEEENREPARLWNLEQDVLVAENGAEVARVRARNQEIPAERAAFQARRREIIDGVGTSTCGTDGFEEECEEIRVLSPWQIGLTGRLTASAHLRFPANGCGVTLYYGGASTAGIGAALTQPLELTSVRADER